MLQLDPPDKGLPDSVIFDTFFAKAPDGVPSNIPPLFSPLQYTIFDVTIAPVSQNTYSSNLVVTDNCFQGCISHDFCIAHQLTSQLNDTLLDDTILLSLIHYIQLQYLSSL